MADDEHHFVGIWALLFVILVCLAMFAGHLIRKYNILWLPESIASMLLGFISGGLIVATNRDSESFVTFQPEVFFYILLPPIIFEAGYTMKKKKFFTNMGSILLFAVVGTIISTLVIGYGLYAMIDAGLELDEGNGPLECLAYGSVLSATDPVATLAILGSKSVAADPLLYSLVFGESVLNDAISIVLFNTFHSQRGEPFTNSTVFKVAGIFIGVSIGSIVIGITIALCCSFILKRASLTPAYEFILIFFFAYSSYIIPEIMGLSGIASLFFCGVLLSHYNWYNISPESQATTKHLFKAFAAITETFLFAYLGITAVISFQGSPALTWSPRIMFGTLFWVLLSRACNIFPMAFLANLKRTRFPITFKMQIVMWLAGIRGAIAFALSLNLDTASRPYLVTTTIFIILVTTLVFGGVTAPVLHRLGLSTASRAPGASGDGDDNSFKQMQHSEPLVAGGDSDEPADMPTSGSGGVRTARNALRQSSSAVKRWFREIDDKYLKVWFGGSTTDHSRAQAAAALAAGMTPSGGGPDVLIAEYADGHQSVLRTPAKAAANGHSSSPRSTAGNDDSNGSGSAYSAPVHATIDVPLGPLPAIESKSSSAAAAAVAAVSPIPLRPQSTAASLVAAVADRSFSPDATAGASGVEIDPSPAAAPDAL